MAAAPRLFVPGPLAAGGAVALTPEQAHRLTRVLRLGPGATLTLLDGASGVFAATLEPAGRGVAARIGGQLRPHHPEPGPVLAVAAIKRLDLVVEKAVELGASAILPVATRRTVVTRLNLDRLRAVAVEAAEQCERLTLPRLAPLTELPELLASWDPRLPLIACVERAAAPHLARIAPAGPAAALIGPEGGFDDAELDLLRRLDFVLTATLGPRVLRAETAAIAAIAHLAAAGA